MENNNVEDGELFKFFREKSQGVGYTFEQLYRECTGYADTFAFSREISRLTKLKLIEKRNRHYYYVDPTQEIKRLLQESPEIREQLGVEESPAVEPKPAPRVHLVERKEPPKPAEPETKPELTKPLPFGKLRRGSAATPIALTFCYNQHDEFCTAELTRRTGVNQQVASQTVRRMVDDGIIVQTRQEGRSPYYKWAAAVRYPFPEVQPEDRNWKHVRVEQIPPAPNEPGKTAEPAAAEAAEPAITGLLTAVRNDDPYLTTLEEMIRRHEAELVVLRISREAYLASKDRALAA
jgi:DNA-binding transcriptional ArsR family regulator